MVNILIVEDDVALSNGIKLALKNDDFCFFQAYDIKTAIELLSDDNYNLVLLDVNLPDGSGFDLLTNIRKRSNVPVIILTANNMELDIVTGLEMGADDYITKPFSLMVLRARVNLQLRKAGSRSNEISIDNFSFNFDNMEFRKNRELVELSKTEQKLLRLLVENKGSTLSRDFLVDRIWTDGSEYVDENALSVTINRLRKKLENNPSKPVYIKTVYGIGYTWAVK